MNFNDIPFEILFYRALNLAINLYIYSTLNTLLLNNQRIVKKLRAYQSKIFGTALQIKMLNILWLWFNKQTKSLQIFSVVYF